MSSTISHALHIFRDDGSPQNLHSPTIIGFFWNLNVWEKDSIIDNLVPGLLLSNWLRYVFTFALKEVCEYGHSAKCTSTLFMTAHIPTSFSGIFHSGFILGTKFGCILSSLGPNFENLLKSALAKLMRNDWISSSRLCPVATLSAPNLFEILFKSCLLNTPHGIHALWYISAVWSSVKPKYSFK